MLRLRRMPLAQLRLRALLKPSQSKPYGFASSPKGESFIKVKIMSETKLSHFDASGSAVMVDVSEKPVTARQAVARGIITMNAAAFAAVRDGTAQKGDVLGVARIAGIMAAKRTSELIPLCHPLPLSKLTVDFHLLPEQQAVEAVCTARTIGVTGVEMEALTGVSAALSADPLPGWWCPQLWHPAHGRPLPRPQCGRPWQTRPPRFGWSALHGPRWQWMPVLHRGSQAYGCWSDRPVFQFCWWHGG